MTYPPMQFPHGFDVEVRRKSTTPTRYGSLDGHADWVVVATIGPCNYVRQNRDAGGEHQDSPLVSAIIGAPVNSDVRVGDQLRPPGEDWMDVIGDPGQATNPFTGWQPPMRIQLERTRFEGGE